MFRSTIFNDVLKQLPTRKVREIILKNRGDRYRKTYSVMDHLHIMLAAQLSSCKSLRDTQALLNAQRSSFYHLGLTSVKRSTISDANKSMKPQIFKEIALTLLDRLRGEKREVRNLVTALDSSIIRAEGRGQEWSLGSRQGSKGMKLHLQFDSTNEHIESVEVSDANLNDITVAQRMTLEKDRIYVFDRGYFDYNWWHQIAALGATFVTRLKKNTQYRVLKTVPIQPADEGFVLSDQWIELTNKTPRAHKINHLAGTPLRLIAIRHPDPTRKDPLIIVSNDCVSQSNVITAWYKQRWSIELVFKWLKQNLKVKTFLGESRNALLIQIFVAIIAYVLLKLHALQRQHQPSFKDFVTIVKNCLFSRPLLDVYHKKKRQQIQEVQPSLFAQHSFVRPQ